MNWIKEHIRLLIIMIVIALLMAIIIVSSSQLGRGNIIEVGVNTVSSAVTKPTSAAGNGITSFFSGLIHFRSTQRENYRLNQELEELKEELAKASLSEDELEQLRNLYNELNLSEYDDSYQRVTAEVISIDSSDIFDIFNISAGSDDGIKTDDIVINQDGLVGRVMSVGNNWAKVMSIIDSSNSISFTITRDPEIIGIISGNGQGSMSGYIFDETKSVVEGDTLITSGIGYYPKGIEIGEVTSINIDSGTKQKTVEADSSVNFKSIRFVTVLTK
jgi:rod shape-determining protein MreC